MKYRLHLKCMDEFRTAYYSETLCGHFRRHEQVVRRDDPRWQARTNCCQACARKEKRMEQIGKFTYLK